MPYLSEFIPQQISYNVSHPAVGMVSPFKVWREPSSWHMDNVLRHEECFLWTTLRVQNVTIGGSSQSLWRHWYFHLRVPNKHQLPSFDNKFRLSFVLWKCFSCNHGNIYVSWLHPVTTALTICRYTKMHAFLIKQSYMCADDHCLCWLPRRCRDLWKTSIRWRHWIVS